MTGHCKNSACRSRAFSLIEVVISMVLLSLILGSVFGIVWQATDSAADVKMLDARDQQVSRFLSLYRRTLETLPAGSTVSITPAEESDSGQEEMTIDGAATAFVLGMDVDSGGETVISLISQEETLQGDLETYDGPLFRVAISREEFKPVTDGDDMAFRVDESDPFFEIDDNGRYWLPLLDNVISMSWRYWDSDQREWLDLWEEDTMPEILELSLLDPWRSSPLRIVFEMPAHLVEGNQASATGSDTSDTSTTDTGSSATPASDRTPSDAAPAGGGGRGGDPRRGGRGSRGDGSGRGGRPDQSGGPGSGNGRPGGGAPSGGGTNSGGGSR